MEPILEFKNVSKTYPGVKALKRVSFEIYPGEVHALVGENGAGKSTLMNVLLGVVPYDRDDGEILYHGKLIRFSSPAEAQRAGIAMIHQELSLAEKMSVKENIFLGRYKANKAGFISNRAMYDEAKKYLAQLGLNKLDPNASLKHLSVSHRQMIEIAKALAWDAKIIIMDEPSASLTEREVEILLNNIKKLREKGFTIVYISHKLEEIFQIADRITVMRDGTFVNTVNVNDATHKDLISMMVGRTLENDVYVPSAYDKKQVVLRVENLNWGKKVKDVNFELYKGEILGLSGLVGAGRSELVMSIFGFQKPDSGDIWLNNTHIKQLTPKKAIDAGICLLPEDRKMQSLFMEMTVCENISIGTLKNYFSGLFINKNKERKGVNVYVEKLRVKTPNLFVKIKNLSGGNQQKCILARWLLSNPQVLIMDEPTHGIDVGAKAEIYDLMRNLTKEGVSIILISSELPEILRMSDRVAIMSEGRLVKILDHEDATSEAIMHYATASH